MNEDNSELEAARAEYERWEAKHKGWKVEDGHEAWGDWHFSYCQAAHVLIPLLQARLHAAERELASARAALAGLVGKDMWMEDERVSSKNVCHYCRRSFNGWNTVDEHTADCPVLTAQAALAANAEPTALATPDAPAEGDA